MRTYTFKIVINECKDEFWEELKDTGCDKVLSITKEALGDCWYYSLDSIVLIKYEDKGDN